jgi:hypothetical protein
MTTAVMQHALTLLSNRTLSIDTEGRIWRHAIKTNTGRRLSITPRRAESIGGKGYLRIMLRIDGRLRGVGAHRLVWTYHNGPIPDELQINHRDLNKHNNALNNLELVTASENIRHSYANSRPRPWHKAQYWRGRRRVSAQQINEARHLRSSGTRLKDICATLGISISHAHRLTS